MKIIINNIERAIEINDKSICWNWDSTNCEGQC